VVHWLFIAALSTAHAAAPETRSGETASHESAREGSEPGGKHEVFFTDDDDQDGVPNWRDPKNGSQPNTETYEVMPLVWHFVNFGLLIGGLVYAARQPLLDTFRERALAIRHELTDSARARDEAHQRHQELLARLDKIETEVRGMEQEAEADARREEQKLVDRAQREASRIAEQAERNIRDETARARQELRTEAVRLAVRLAEGTLRTDVKAADQQKLARDFLNSVRQAPAPPGSAPGSAKGASDV